MLAGCRGRISLVLVQSISQVADRLLSVFHLAIGRVLKIAGEVLDLFNFLLQVAPEAGEGQDNVLLYIPRLFCFINGDTVVVAQELERVVDAGRFQKIGWCCHVTRHMGKFDKRLGSMFVVGLDLTEVGDEVLEYLSPCYIGRETSVIAQLIKLRQLGVCQHRKGGQPHAGERGYHEAGVWGPTLKSIGEDVSRGSGCRNRAVEDALDIFWVRCRMKGQAPNAAGPTAAAAVAAAAVGRILLLERIVPHREEMVVAGGEAMDRTGALHGDGKLVSGRAVDDGAATLACVPVLDESTSGSGSVCGCKRRD